MKLEWLRPCNLRQLYYWGCPPLLTHASPPWMATSFLLLCEGHYRESRMVHNDSLPMSGIAHQPQSLACLHAHTYLPAEPIASTPLAHRYPLAYPSWLVVSSHNGRQPRAAHIYCTRDSPYSPQSAQVGSCGHDAKPAHLSGCRHHSLYGGCGWLVAVRAARFENTS